MSDKLRFELNWAGVRELLRSSEIQAVLEAEAASRAAALGDGYTTNARVGQNRVSVRIVAESREAREENLRDNTLLTAIS